jgi:pyruvate,water dikinase
MSDISPASVSALEQEQVRQEEIAALKARAIPGGTVWSRYGLAELLPEPTPMTWSVIQKLVSPAGGFGLMYRDLGIHPDRRLGVEGVYDLICGRVYCNLSREPLMYANGLPLRHSFGALKAAPDKALCPRAELDWSSAGWKFWLSFPRQLAKSLGTSLRWGWAQKTFAKRSRNQILPQFNHLFGQEAERDLSQLNSQQLLECLQSRVDLSLKDFARHSLKPGAFADLLLFGFRRTVGDLTPEQRETAIVRVAAGLRLDAEIDLSAGIRDLSDRRITREYFLRRFGHRGWNEMELAQPRWQESPSEIDSLLAQPPSTRASILDTSAVHNKIMDQVKVHSAQQREEKLRETSQQLCTFLALRETAKHYFMKGYALIRACLLELDRRYRLKEGIFYLALDELPRLVVGENFASTIAERRHRRAVALSLEMPSVLFSDDLQAIGRHTSVQSVGWAESSRPIGQAETLKGVPLSGGVAEGTTLVLEKPDGAAPAGPYILVCPTTDPAWVPFMIQARGLIMETGGVLSHGAILAREFGVPAVAGLPGICRQIQTGARVRLDGSTGSVTLLPPG